MIKMNECKFIGRLTRDVEDKGSNGPFAVGSFADNSNDYKPKDAEEWVNKPMFMDFSAGFPREANHLLKYGQKGRQFLLSGKIEMQEWESKDGEKRTKLCLKIERAQCMDLTPEEFESSKSNNAAPAKKSKTDVDFDDGGKDDEDFDF